MINYLKSDLYILKKMKDNKLIDFSECDEIDELFFSKTF